ncbi:MAG: 3-dehydroquinate synthase [Acutalibacteraceae bacterium]
MVTIPIHSNTRDYDIVLGSGALENIKDLIDLNRKVLIVTDSGVPKEYSEKVATGCLHPVPVCINQGEASKNMDEFTRLLSTMLHAGFTRGDCVVAVGGGVVGDLSGFAASCYMRGIDFYNIPTTLLSQVDSSIGGKTAVDFDGVKNVFGSFYQPKRVIIDPSTLQTLDERQLRAGLAEAIKMAATNDAELFTMLEKADDLHSNLPEIIRRALLIKKSVVEEDPTEKGLRRVLNFGHTIGHAIESDSEGKLLHGESVALGMLPMCSASVRSRLINILKKYQLPTEITQSAEQLMPYILHDKKKKDACITTVFVDEIGMFRFQNMLPEEISNCLENMQ